MQPLAKQPFGTVLLWLVAIGMFLLVVWRVIEDFVGHQEYDGGKRWRKRAVSAFKAVVYGSSPSSPSGSRSARVGAEHGLHHEAHGPAVRALDRRSGRLAIAVYGVSSAPRLDREVHGEPRRRGPVGEAGTAYRIVGKLGYIAKGIAFGIVGGLFVAPPSPTRPRSRAASTRPCTPCLSSRSARSY